jgi:hypothetical protein
MKRSVSTDHLQKTHKKRSSSRAVFKKRPVRHVHRKTSKLAKRPLLVHVRHTGKLLPHSTTSYPLLTFLVLMVGVLMAVCSSMVTADNPGPMSDYYVVNAVVPGTAPSSPAVITSPVDQDRFSNVPITVKGTCPQYATYIKLYRNDFFSGAALCNQGEFTLQTDLFPGANQLKVHSYNPADIEGPISAPVKVYYNVPVQSSGNTGTSTGNSGTNTGSSSGGSTSHAGSVPAPTPLVISADYLYRGYYVNQKIDWKFGISGGAAPYSIHYDWGDGKDTIIRQTSSGVLNITHTYTSPVTKKTAYIIKITATDAQGNSTFMQLVVLIAVPGTHGAGVVTGFGNNPLMPKDIIERFVPYAWPTYGITLLMLTSFWLGEHREFNLLRNHLRSPKRFRGA